MKTMRQLIRQPLKTLSGLLLMTIATSILCICVGQALAAKKTAENLNNQFSTIALPSPSHISEWGEGITSAEMPLDLLSWLQETAQSHPEIVKGIAQQGFLSAYIPELTPMNFTTGSYIADCWSSGNWQYYYHQPHPSGRPYSCAMLVITLEEVTEPKLQSYKYPIEGDYSSDDFGSTREYFEWLNSAPSETVDDYYSMKLSGTITGVVALQEGYRDPTGMIARLSISACTLEELEALNLVPGQQYIVYGMNYYDEDWALRGELADDRNYRQIQIDEFDMSKMYMLTKEEQAKYLATNRREAVARYDGWLYLSSHEYKQVNAISMTLDLPITSNEYDVVRENGNGKLLEIRPILEQTFEDTYGNTLTYTNEEYIRRYQIPTIAKLEGSVEDFMQSAAGAKWQETLNLIAVNNQSFATIGVDKLTYLTTFTRGETRIVDGRDFTTQELQDGSRVCIIQENLAAQNGLKIGDTITLNFYQTDPALPYQAAGKLNPSASFYFSTTPFTETAEYTIVGFWRGKDVWPDVAFYEYDFSPNTVFVPNSSVQTVMEHPNSVLFTTTVIHNGKLDDFRSLAAEKEYQNRFVYSDQGYSVISQNFHNYEELARQVLIIGAVIYMLLFFLFLLLYPVMQRKVVATMQSLGTTFGKRFIHVLASSAAIIVPATIFGGLAGVLLWDRVVDALQASADAATALQLEPVVLVMIAAVQLLLGLMLTIFVALFVAAPQGMSRRK